MSSRTRQGARRAGKRKRKSALERGSAQILRLAFYHFQEDQFLRFSRKVFCEAQA